VFQLSCSWLCHEKIHKKKNINYGGHQNTSQPKSRSQTLYTFLCLPSCLPARQFQLTI
jgi:hypothetical protein